MLIAGGTRVWGQIRRKRRISLITMVRKATQSALRVDLASAGERWGVDSAMNEGLRAAFAGREAHEQLL